MKLPRGSSIGTSIICYCNHYIKKKTCYLKLFSRIITYKIGATPSAKTKAITRLFVFVRLISC